jgi:flagellar hook-associated protein 1 FlgK
LTTTLGDYVAQTTGQNANTAAAAKSNANDQTALLSQLTTQYSSETGVSLDAELTKLVVYQNAYSASAKVITTVQTMFDTLMNI